MMSLYFMPLHPLRCSFIYAVSCLLDALDGYFARKLNQHTKFGAVLDMVTDRCTTTCLLVFLATAMLRYAMAFQLLISLDLASHYVHMYATLSMGGGGSHKNVDAKRSWLLHLYYSNKVGLRRSGCTSGLTWSDCVVCALLHERVVLPRIISSCFYWAGGLTGAFSDDEEYPKRAMVGRSDGNCSVRRMIYCQRH